MEAHVGEIRRVPDRVSTKARPAFSGVNIWLTELAQQKKTRKKTNKKTSKKTRKKKKRAATSILLMTA